MARWGITLPLTDGGLAAQREPLARLRAAGYVDAWSAEVAQYDAFTPLVLANEWEPGMNLGTAIVPAFTRGPATLAVSAAAMAELAPGRFTLGVGSSSDVIVSKWNSVPFERPYYRTRDVVRFLRMALAGEKVDREFDTFAVRGFRLASPPAEVPKILVAALREQMLRMAGRESDGAIINWLSPEDAGKVVPIVGEDKEIVARVFVAPVTDRSAFLEGARRAIAAYLNVGVYADFHRWLGRGEQLEQMWELWARGDRAGAVRAIPEEVVDALVVGGTADQCRRRIAEYFDNGVSVVTLAVMPFGVDPLEAALSLAPGAAEGD
ncbi:MAG: LLM class F420-dependent oxidoreductase [Nitrospiraceae bacterium]|nr:LLM class F420-dependent oxidoreductase [Nitrospiraceae bacterium]